LEKERGRENSAGSALSTSWTLPLRKSLGLSQRISLYLKNRRKRGKSGQKLPKRWLEGLKIKSKIDLMP